MTLRPIATDLWTLDADLRLPGGFTLPVRTTVVRLPDGGLWIHSPVRLSDADAQAIEALGPVRHLVAPSLLHHLFLGEAAARWPDATTWGAPGLARKRPDLRIDHTLTDGAPPWGDALDAVHVAGAPGIAETVFLHRPTRSLICTDLVFHVRTTASWLTPWVLRLTGTWGRLAQSRAWWFAIRDRAAAAAAADRLLAWDFDRVIMAHGEVIDTDAKTRLTRALAWMRAGARGIRG